MVSVEILHSLPSGVIASKDSPHRNDLRTSKIRCSPLRASTTYPTRLSPRSLRCGFLIRSIARSVRLARKKPCVILAGHANLSAAVFCLSNDSSNPSIFLIQFPDESRCRKSSRNTLKPVFCSSGRKSNKNKSR